MWTSVSPAWLESRSGSKSKRYTYENEEKRLGEAVSRRVRIK